MCRGRMEDCKELCRVCLWFGRVEVARRQRVIQDNFTRRDEAVDDKDAR